MAHLFLHPTLTHKPFIPRLQNRSRLFLTISPWVWDQWDPNFGPYSNSGWADHPIPCHQCKKDVSHCQRHLIAITTGSGSHSCPLSLLLFCQKDYGYVAIPPLIAVAWKMVVSKKKCWEWTMPHTTLNHNPILPKCPIPSGTPRKEPLLEMLIIFCTWGCQHHGSSFAQSSSPTKCK